MRLKDQVVDDKEEKARIRFKFGIDRDQENQEVLEYRKTGNERLFEKLYARRVPTFKYLANKNSWLIEDSYSEILIVFLRTVRRYGSNGKKTDFNTFFFSSVKNHFSNIAKKKFRKKRTTIEGYDPSLYSVPLDSCIDHRNDSPLFHELIEDTKINSDDNEEALAELVHRVCCGNEFLIKALGGMLDMTRRQITRRKHEFEFSCRMITGEAYDDICHEVGIPEELFEIKDIKVNGDRIFCKISLNPREFLDFLCEMAVEKGIVPEVIEG